MPRLWSDSVDDIPCSKVSYDATDDFPSRLSHAASAMELRSHAESPAPPGRQSHGFQHPRGAASSLPFVDINHNARTSTSNSESTYTVENFPSLNASERDGCVLRTWNQPLRLIHLHLPRKAVTSFLQLSRVITLRILIPFAFH